jgi:hypothetical protein
LATPSKVVSELAATVAASSPAAAPSATSEQVTTRREGDTLEARSTSRRIRTVEDLLEHIEADLERFEVAASEATKWEVGCSDGEGGTNVTELHRVFVRLKPRGGPTTQQMIAAMIEAAKGELKRPKVPKGKAATRRLAPGGRGRGLSRREVRMGQDHRRR